MERLPFMIKQGW